MKRMKFLYFLIFLLGFSMPDTLWAQNNNQGKLADKPLFRDPVFDGAADPTIIWNKNEKKWFMFYTNRRANAKNETGVTWVHGTRIGIAESSDDGATWKYRDTANINYRPDKQYTQWAPEVIEYKGLYHIYLTYVPGIFTDWNHPRVIVHLTSKDLLNWKYESVLKLANEKVIDACVIQMPDGNWRMWYNNEKDGKSIYYADSPDLYNWQDKGKAVGDRSGEGPNVFKWKDKYWLLVDNWAGFGLYYSTDLLNWTKQPDRILEKPGTGPEDGFMGNHADVIVSGDRAFIIYFVHPGKAKKIPGSTEPVDTKRSVIQIAELGYENGYITCDRDKPVYLKLKHQ
jgi:sucrose-6-phosphate hydrolase SacC (GH32 family)